jgi:magnesium-transporting ATPase (P-type)
LKLDYYFQSNSTMAKRNQGVEAPEHVSGQANKPLTQPPHALTCEVFIAELTVNTERGLSSQDAEQRLEEHGPNELDNGPGVQPVKILIKQIANAMILVKRSTIPLLDHRFSDPIITGPDFGHGSQLRNWLLH